MEIDEEMVQEQENEAWNDKWMDSMFLDESLSLPTTFNPSYTHTHSFTSVVIVELIAFVVKRCNKSSRNTHISCVQNRILYNSLNISDTLKDLKWIWDDQDGLWIEIEV